MKENPKTALALLCGLLGCLCFGVGDWPLGVSDFIREYTLASGGPHCDCGSGNPASGCCLVCPPVCWQGCL